VLSLVCGFGGLKTDTSLRRRSALSNSLISQRGQSLSKAHTFSITLARWQWLLRTVAAVIVGLRNLATCYSISDFSFNRQYLSIIDLKILVHPKFLCPVVIVLAKRKTGIEHLTIYYLKATTFKNFLI
jgi:hypothetical protein